MKEIISFELDGKIVKIFPADNENAPIIYANMFMEVGEEMVKDCIKLKTKPFTLVSISHLQWDQELSPWPHAWVIEPNDDFTGGADDYWEWMKNVLIPKVEEKVSVDPSKRILLGYSMAGLFALWVPYLSDMFSGIVSASGSVWYPGFLSYVKEHPYSKTNKPKAIYLSIGKLESHTDNAVVNTTQAVMEKLEVIFKKEGIKTTFVLEPGNHYYEPVLRMARGVKWILDSLENDQL